MTTGQNRRKADKMEELTDHELLIIHSLKIDTLCKMMEKYNATFDKYIEKMDNRCLVSNNKYDDIKKEIPELVKNSTMRWGLVILISILLSLARTLSYNQKAISVNIKAIESIEKSVDKNSEDIGKLHTNIDKVRDLIDEKHKTSTNATTYGIEK